MPILPGTLLVLGALILVWADDAGDRDGLGRPRRRRGVAGRRQVVKYAVPGRRLKEAGLPTSTL